METLMRFNNPGFPSPSMGFFLPAIQSQGPSYPFQCPSFNPNPFSISPHSPQLPPLLPPLFPTSGSNILPSLNQLVATSNPSSPLSSPIAPLSPISTPLTSPLPTSGRLSPVSRSPPPTTIKSAASLAAILDLDDEPVRISQNETQTQTQKCPDAKKLQEALLEQTKKAFRKKQHSLNDEEEREFESKRVKRGQTIPKEWSIDKKQRYKKWLKHRHYLLKKQEGTTTSKEYLEKQNERSRLRYQQQISCPELYEKMRAQQRVYERNSKRRMAVVKALMNMKQIEDSA